MRFREEGLVEDPGLANTNKAVPTAMHHVVINLLYHIIITYSPLFLTIIHIPVCLARVYDAMTAPTMIDEDER